jgi:hypothetical protein
LIVCLSDKKVNVAGFDPSQCEVADLDLVSAALTCNCLTTAGEAIMLMVHQVVHIPMMKIDLLCPMQMRMNDIEAHVCPKVTCPTSDPSWQQNFVSRLRAPRRHILLPHAQADNRRACQLPPL